MHVAIFFFLKSRKMSETLFSERFVSFLIWVGIFGLSSDLIIFVRWLPFIIHGYSFSIVVG